MDALLTKQRIHIEPDKDHVLLNIGRLQVDMPYAASFQVAQGLRLAAKDAMRHAKEDVTGWRDHAALDELPTETTPYKIADQQRITVRRDFTWMAGYEGENVKVKFGNNELKFHFVAALKISEWLRDAGKRAKAWAGDGGRSMIAAAVISDAEENYKLGIN